MCRYALSIGADFKLATGVDKMHIICDFLNNYNRIIIMDDICIINKQTPNLFELIKEDDLGAIDTGKCLDFSLLIISKSHKFLFNQQTECPLDEYLNSVVDHKQGINLHLLPVKFCQSSVGCHPEQYKNIRKYLDHDYINDQYIMNVTHYYKHQLFYVSYICDIYNNRCYLTQQIHFEFNLLDDLIREINRLKKIRKNKFGMLVFGLGADAKLWYHTTERKIFFIECDQQPIASCLEIPHTQIIRYSCENIKLMNSFTISETVLDSFKLPIQLKHMSFDVILINSPEGTVDTDPSKLIPVYWSSKYLSHKGSLIYMCCCDRLLETYCLDKYMNQEYYTILSQFNEIQKTVKLLRIK